MMIRWQTLRSGASVACLLLSSGLSGCVFGEQSDPPVLTVDLYWEYDLRTGHDWTCDTVPVAAMGWQLRDSHGDVISEPKNGKKEDCHDRMNFYDLDPGSYQLDVTGYNDAGDKAWEGSCQLELDRFDQLSDCTINQV